MKTFYLLIRALVFVVILQGCKDTSLAADCSNTNLSVDDGNRLAAGTWNLLTIKSGWSSEIHKPTKLTELTIDTNQQAIIREDDSEVVRFKLNLIKNYTWLVYRADNVSNSNTALIPMSGRFRVCNSNLILDATDVDGPLFTYERLSK